MQDASAVSSLNVKNVKNVKKDIKDGLSVSNLNVKNIKDIKDALEISYLHPHHPLPASRLPDNGHDDHHGDDQLRLCLFLELSFVEMSQQSPLLTSECLSFIFYLLSFIFCLVYNIFYLFYVPLSSVVCLYHLSAVS